jgi:hypothetical protein
LVSATSVDGKDKIERDVEIKDKGQVVLHLNLIPVQSARLEAETSAAQKSGAVLQHPSASSALGSDGTPALAPDRPAEVPPATQVPASQPTTTKSGEAHLTTQPSPTGSASIHLIRSAISKSKGYGDPTVNLDGTKLVDRIKINEHYDVRVASGVHSMDMKGGHHVHDHTFAFNCSPGAELFLKIDVTASGFHAEWSVESLDAFNGRAGVADSKSIGHADLTPRGSSNSSIPTGEAGSQNPLKVGASPSMENPQVIATQPVSSAAAVGSSGNAADFTNTATTDTEIDFPLEINGGVFIAKGRWS